MPDRTFKREQVVEILGSVLNRISSEYPLDNSLVDEMSYLKDAIDRMHEELNFAHPSQIQSHIPSATDELDAIVTTTETATHTIMEACEAIQRHISDQPMNRAADIEGEITRIIEACTFQDLTGQRITKIIKSLAEIDKRASQLSQVLSERFATLQGKQVAQPQGDPLLNGPALPSQGISQEEIDKLLNDF